MVFKDVNVFVPEQNFPGDVVNGTLSFFINSSKDVEVAELYVKFSGVTKVSWSESDTDGESKNISANETYFKLRHDFITDLTSLRFGKHSYKFSFRLPQNIPQTFKGNHGEVKYMLKVVAKRPWSLKSRYEFIVNVDAQLIIEERPELMLPHHLSLEKTFGCCISGIISIDVMLPKTGYLCGEVINVTLNVENGSNGSVKDLVIKLRKQIEYIAGSSKDKQSSTIGKVHTGALSNRLPRKLDCSIQIPHDLETFNLKDCNIINFDYLLFIKAIFSGISTSLTQTIPLVITKRLN